MKIPVKNLWARRKRNIWLFLELIVVTVVTWVVIDPVAVNYFALHNRLNYDADKLALFECAIDDSDLDQAMSDSILGLEAHRMVADIRKMPEVERATVVATYAMLDGGGYMMGIMNANDNFTLYYKWIEFPQQEDFFQTYGFRMAPGSPSLEELDQMSFTEDDRLMTRTMAEFFFGDVKAAVGKNALDCDTVHFGKRTDFHVVGVVEDVRSRSYNNEPYTYFNLNNKPNYNNLFFVARLKDGVDHKQLYKRLNADMPDFLQGENIKVKQVYDYTDMIEAQAEAEGIYAKIQLKLVIAVLFLVNLCLGVVGAFYLQTRQRREEAGIMRSFGARRGRIMRMLLCEGWLMTTAAWLIGCAAYLLWALHEGLVTTVNSNAALGAPIDWTHRFWVHFPVVSLIVYAILIAVVFIGIILPARQLSRINPVDALHEE